MFGLNRERVMFAVRLAPGVLMQLPRLMLAYPKLGGAVVATASTVGYVGYQYIYTVITTFIGAIKLGVVASVPLVNAQLAHKAIELRNAGGLDFHLSISELLKKIPSIGTDLTVRLDHNVLPNAIEQQNYEVAKVLINSGLVDLNEENSAGKRPLAAALERRHGDEIALSLIRKGTNLKATGTRDASQPLFQDIVASGKQALVRASLEQDNAQSLLTTKAATGDYPAHLSAVNPWFRKTIEDSGLSLPFEAYQPANNAGRYPLDVAIRAHEQFGEVYMPAHIVVTYVKPGSHVSLARPFARAFENDNLRQAGLPQILFDQSVIDPNVPDIGSQALPLQLVMDHKAGDNFAANVAVQTNADIVRDNMQFLGTAFTLQYRATQQILIDNMKFSANQNLRMSFYNSQVFGPGKRSFVKELLADKNIFQEDFFRLMYKDFRSTTHIVSSPISSAGWLIAAIRAKNTPAVRLMMKIIKEEGIAQHLSFFVSQDGIPAMLAHGYANALDNLFNNNVFALNSVLDGLSQSQYLENAEQINLLSAQLQDGMSSVKRLKLDSSGVKNDGGQLVPANHPADIAIVDPKIPEFFGRLRVTDRYMALEREQEARAQAIRDGALDRNEEAKQAMANAAHVDDDRGMPGRIAQQAMSYPPLPRQHINTMAFTTGYGLTKLIDNREAVKHVLRQFESGKAIIDRFEPDQSSLTSKALDEAAWGALYFGTSTLTAYGVGIGNGLTASTIKAGAAMTAPYLVRRALMPSLWHDYGYIPASSKSELDFVYQFAPSIAFDSVLSIISTGTVAWMTGAALGPYGVVLPMMVTAGTSFTQYHNAYWSDQASDDSISITGSSLLGTLAASTILYKMPVNAAGLGYKLQMINKLSTALASFVTTQQLTKLVLDVPTIHKALVASSEAAKAAYGVALEAYKAYSTENIIETSSQDTIKHVNISIAGLDVCYPEEAFGA